MKPTIYEKITQQIVTAIEEGAADFRMPWHRAPLDMQPVNAVTGRSYRGLNIISLWMVAREREFSSAQFATYQQWQEKGAQVRKGEKSATVFFWKNLNEGDASTEQDEEGSRGRFVARAYNVFNADQVDGYDVPIVPLLPESERIASAEAFFAGIPATIEHDRPMACYSPTTDSVQMVSFSRFTRPSAFYSVLGHELTHWSGAKTRLDRDLSGRFGSESYAMEELVAELGAAFLGAQLGLGTEPRTDHAPYIATWLKALRNDARAIFTAASKAQAAADYLQSFTTEKA